MITAATCGVLYDVGEVEGPSEHQANGGMNAVQRTV
jgi:hypothetical protein